MPQPFANLIATKATGKAQTGSGPGQSNIMEQAAKKESKDLMADVVDKGQIQMDQQESQREAIAEEGKTQYNAIQAQETEQEFSDMQQVQGLLQKGEFSELELENREDALNLETSAHKLMMQDKAYVHQIREIGRRRRLTDSLKFAEEMDRHVYGEELSMLLDELGWKEGEGQLARDRSEELFNMDMDTAMAIAAADIKQSQSQAIGQGVIDAGTAYVSSRPKTPKGKTVKIENTEELPAEHIPASSNTMMS